VRSNYHAFITRLIHKYEGGYGWVAADAGGPTKYGITCFRLAEHRGQTMDSMARWAPIVQAMGLSEAEDIYKKWYTAPVFFDRLKTGCDCVMMDYGVNSGPGRPLAVAQKLTGAKDRGVDLVNAINHTDARWFINAMCDERLAFMRAIKGGSQWKVFGRGWQARVDDLRAYCLALAAKQPVEPAIDLSHVPTPKAINDAPAGTTVGAGTTGSLGAGAAAKAAGYSWTIALVVVVAGVLATISLIVWQKYRAKKLNETVILPASIQPRPGLAL